MSVFKKLYKDFFGLTEQSTPTGAGAVKMPKDAKPADIKKITDTGVDVRLEGEVDEAKLVNNITDYRGGVEFVLRDPADAVRVTNEIQQWTAKKGITLVKKQIAKTGKVVYLYFRLGEDPGTESQKIQGYLAQMPELKHFRFNVRGEQAPTPTSPEQIPSRKI
jgi:hypothetical protein